MKCARCADGALKVDAKLVSQVKGAYNAAAKTSALAKETAALFTASG